MKQQRHNAEANPESALRALDVELHFSLRSFSPFVSHLSHHFSCYTALSLLATQVMSARLAHVICGPQLFCCTSAFLLTCGFYGDRTGNCNVKFVSLRGPPSGVQLTFDLSCAAA